MIDLDAIAPEWDHTSSPASFPTLQQLQECLDQLAFGDLPAQHGEVTSGDDFLALFGLGQLIVERLLATQESLLTQLATREQEVREAKVRVRTRLKRAQHYNVRIGIMHHANLRKAFAVQRLRRIAIDAAGHSFEGLKREGRLGRSWPSNNRCSSYASTSLSLSRAVLPVVLLKSAHVGSGNLRQVNIGPSARMHRNTQGTAKSKTVDQALGPFGGGGGGDVRRRRRRRRRDTATGNYRVDEMMAMIHVDRSRRRASSLRSGGPGRSARGAAAGEEKRRTGRRGGHGVCYRSSREDDDSVGADLIDDNNDDDDDDEKEEEEDGARFDAEAWLAANLRRVSLGRASLHTQDPWATSAGFAAASAAVGPAPAVVPGIEDGEVPSESLSQWWRERATSTSQGNFPSPLPFSSTALPSQQTAPSSPLSSFRSFSVTDHREESDCQDNDIKQQCDRRVEKPLGGGWTVDGGAALRDPRFKPRRQDQRSDIKAHPGHPTEQPKVTTTKEDKAKKTNELEEHASTKRDEKEKEQQQKVLPRRQVAKSLNDLPSSSSDEADDDDARAAKARDDSHIGRFFVTTADSGQRLDEVAGKNASEEQQEEHDDGHTDTADQQTKESQQLMEECASTPKAIPFISSEKPEAVCARSTINHNNTAPAVTKGARTAKVKTGTNEDLQGTKTTPPRMMGTIGGVPSALTKPCSTATGSTVAGNMENSDPHDQGSSTINGNHNGNDVTDGGTSQVTQQVETAPMATTNINNTGRKASAGGVGSEFVDDDDDPGSSGGFGHGTGSGDELYERV